MNLVDRIQLARSGAVAAAVMMLGLALGAAPAGAAPEPPPAPPAAGSTAPEKTPPAASPAAADEATVKRAQALLDDMVAAYRKLGSYRDEMVTRTDIKVDDPAMEGMFPNEESHGSLAFDRPNRMALATDFLTVHCDGHDLWIAMPSFDRYTKSPAPSEIDLEKLLPKAFQFEGAAVNMDPVVPLLSGPSTEFRKLYPMLDRITGLETEKREDRDGFRVRTTFRMPQLDINGSGTAAPASLWIDKETKTLREMRIDLTDAFNSMITAMGAGQGGDDPMGGAGIPHVKHAEAIIELRKVELNPAIPADTFVYTPGPDAKQVDDLDPSGFAMDSGDQGPPQTDLVAKPAPAFTSTDLDGKDVSLSDYAGHIVVLDFWATWCGPCRRAIPHIQAISEQFADRNVTVLGINSDAAGSESRVRDFVKAQKLTFRQVMDGKGKIGNSYRVTGIPCTVIIDAKGVIQAIHVGYMPGEEDKLVEEIKTLLAGGSLVTTAG